MTWTDGEVVDDQGNFYEPGPYTLGYSLRGPSALDVTAVAGPGGFVITLSNAQTSGLLPGLYFWLAYVFDASGNRTSVGDGQVVVKPDLTKAAAGYDGRSDAEKIVAQIDAAMTAWVANPAAEYSIAGRTFRRENSAALLELRGAYAGIAARERRRERIKQGLGDQTSRFVQFRPSLPDLPGNGNW